MGSRRWARDRNFRGACTRENVARNGTRTNTHRENELFGVPIVHYRGWRICQVNQGVLLALHGAFRGCPSHGPDPLREEPADVGSGRRVLFVAVRQDVADDKASLQLSDPADVAAGDGAEEIRVHSSDHPPGARRMGTEEVWGRTDDRRVSRLHRQARAVRDDPPTAFADGNGRGSRRSIGRPPKAFGDTEQCREKEEGEGQERNSARLLEGQSARGKEGRIACKTPSGGSQKNKKSDEQERRWEFVRWPPKPGGVYEEVYMSKLGRS